MIVEVVRRTAEVMAGLRRGEAADRVVVVMQGDAELLEVVGALDPAGGLAGLLHRRQQQGDEDADDGDHHQQFDECEAATERSMHREDS